MPPSSEDRRGLEHHDGAEHGGGDAQAPPRSDALDPQQRSEAGREHRNRRHQDRGVRRRGVREPDHEQNLVGEHAEKAEAGQGPEIPAARHDAVLHEREDDENRGGEAHSQSRQGQRVQLAEHGARDDVEAAEARGHEQQGRVHRDQSLAPVGRSHPGPVSFARHLAEPIESGRPACWFKPLASEEISMTVPAEADLIVRPVDDLDIGAITAIDERIGGAYRPDVWERRISYYLRRDPDASVVAELDGAIIGFMLGEVRSGEFGLEEPTGWIEVLGVHPDHRERGVGRRLADAMLAHFRSRGASEVRTLVEDSSEGIASFFGSLGFAPATLRPFVRKL